MWSPIETGTCSEENLAMRWARICLLKVMPRQTTRDQVSHYLDYSLIRWNAKKDGNLKPSNIPAYKQCKLITSFKYSLLKLIRLCYLITAIKFCHSVPKSYPNAFDRIIICTGRPSWKNNLLALDYSQRGDREQSNTRPRKQCRHFLREREQPLELANCRRSIWLAESL